MIKLNTHHSPDAAPPTIHAIPFPVKVSPYTYINPYLTPSQNLNISAPGHQLHFPPQAPIPYIFPSLPLFGAPSPHYVHYLVSPSQSASVYPTALPYTPSSDASFALHQPSKSVIVPGLAAPTHYLPQPHTYQILS